MISLRAVAAGAFREDLYHRVNIVTLQVPPLRERRDDIPELVQALIQRANREVGKAITSVEQAVLDKLKARDWPGNVRELEHVIKRSVLVARGPVLTIHDLRFDSGDPRPRGRRRIQHGPPVGGARRAGCPAGRRGRSRRGNDVAVHELAIGRLEQALIRAALDGDRGNQVAAARLLGISRSTLRSKLHE